MSDPGAGAAGGRRPARDAARDRAESLTLYRRMRLIRGFEEAVGRLARAGEVPGFVHLSSGAEASAVGVTAALAPGDVVYSGHRAHGHLLALGSDPARALAEILGRASGLCAGRGGSMHLVDTGVGFWGATGVVGGTLPLALGTALALRPHGRVACVFFGDGASTTGLFHECLNLAALWSLPVLFCCENNGYAEFTARAEQSPVAEVHRFAAVYGMATRCLDALDVEEVRAAAAGAVASVRGGAPFLLELRVARLGGHYEGDAQTYRDRREREAALARDPLARQRQRLLDRWGVRESQLAALEADVEQGVRQATDEARAAAFPAPGDLGVG